MLQTRKLAYFSLLKHKTSELRVGVLSFIMTVDGVKMEMQALLSDAISLKLL